MGSMSFDALSPDSRIWIFQSDRKLTIEEKEYIKVGANHFTDNWVSHNNELQAASKIFHDQFLVFAVDEDIYKASGCSIDRSFSFISKIENKYNLNLLNREQIAFIIEDQVELIPFKNIKLEVDKGRIDSNTLIFNNLIMNKSELDSKWLVPVSDSWISRYL
ncbi:hypothetical protein ACFLU5_12195 [Bacteroidota bacterium]